MVGIDAQSTFCFLLSREEHRDADTWGIRLMELVDRGFASEATIADIASGLRAGHQEALPEVPCRGDVFHALYDVGPLARYLENRAYEAIDARAKLERKQATTSNSRPSECNSSWFAHFDSDKMMRHHRDVEKDLRYGLLEPEPARFRRSSACFGS